MRAWSTLLPALLLALATFVPVSGSAQDRRACAQATRPVAQALAEPAAAHLSKVGSEQAFKDFQDPVGGFLDGDLYVFVFALDGTLMASGAFPHRVGANLMVGYHEPSATQVRNLIAVARAQGKGWSEYTFTNPCSRRRELKISYVIRVGDLVVGVGAYLREGV